MRTLIFGLLTVFILLSVTSCGSSSDGLGEGSLNVTSGSLYLFEEESGLCLNDFGEEGLNSSPGACSDISFADKETTQEILADGLVISGSLIEGADFSGTAVDEEYVLEHALKYNETTLLGDGESVDESVILASKTKLCDKWLSKKNKKTGLYPLGIEKKLKRLNCLE